MKAVRVHAVGGPEVLRYEEVPVPEPGPGQALVQLEAIGVNFLDCYFRAGLYPAPLPFTAGSEGAGTVAAVGRDVHDVRVGDRVAYAPVPGAYAEYATVPVDRLLPLPAGVECRIAAAVTLQGMTAQYLTTDTYRVQPGDTVLIHAAAGGVGQLLVQMAKLRGAQVIGTVSTEEKAGLARAAGADHVINYATQDFEAEVTRLTDGKGVRAVYDAVGRTTFDASLNCVGVRGVLALFGQSSGPVPPFDPARLAKRAVFLTRPGLGHYTAMPAELRARGREVYDLVAQGALRVRVQQTLPLAEAGEAHRMLEGRRTTGKLLLVP